MCRGDLCWETLPNFQAWVEQVGWQRERGLFCKEAEQWHFNCCDLCKGDLTCVCFLAQYVCTWQWQWQTKEKQRQMLFYFLAHLTSVLGQSLWSMKNNCLIAQLKLNRLFSIPTMLAQYRNIQDDIISQHQIPFFPRNNSCAGKVTCGIISAGNQL